MVVGRLLGEVVPAAPAPKVTIIHATDNKSLVSIWRRNRLVKRGSSSAAPAETGRQELQALRTALEERAVWTMEWVPAHPERDQSRSAADWTDLEVGNVKADAAAGAELGEGTRLAWNAAAWERATGGVWRRPLSQRLESIPRGAATRSAYIAEYVGKRRAGDATQSAEDSTPLVEADQAVAWDSRIWSRQTDKDWTARPFRLRLWWGHLLPYLARREPQCRLCGKETLELQWHILAECAHEEMVEKRLSLQQETREQMWSTLKALRAPEHLCDGVSDAFKCVDDKWSRPTDHHRVPGLGVAPRCGLFDKAWILEWWGSAVPKDLKSWRGGLALWRKLGDRAVEECREVWNTSVRIWRREEKKVEWERRRANGGRRSAPPGGATHLQRAAYLQRGGWERGHGGR